MDEIALEDLVGARVDNAFVCAETGLVAISAYTGRKTLLAAGIGPRVTGIGILPRAPGNRAGASHPLVAALRAHVVDHRVRSVSVDEQGVLWIAVGGEGAVARVALSPGRRGEARVIGPTGQLVLKWPGKEAEIPPAAPTLDLSPAALAARGTKMVDLSDRLSGEGMRTALAKAVSRRAQWIERRAEAVRGDLARLGNVEQLQKLGRLLLAQGAKIPRGSTKATLQDWEEGGEVEVVLDPAKPAKSQAETFFAKARRYQRGEVAMRKRLDESERALAALRSLVTEVQAAGTDRASLEALASRAKSLGVSEATAAVAQPGTARRTESRRPYTLFRAWENRPILVGRGGKDNDALITRHARPHDLWLHAKDRTGAHVIVPLEKGQSCPGELLVDAATLAAHFSDARGEPVTDVSYVERRHVRKPKGSAPGAVLFDREKIIAVRVEPERMERLLASRDEQ